MSNPDDGSEARTATSGGSRTPPPRTRRGAPSSRASGAAAPKAAADVVQLDRGPQPAPGSSKAFDWDGDETAAAEATSDAAAKPGKGRSGSAKSGSAKSGSAKSGKSSRTGARPVTATAVAAASVPLPAEASGLDDVAEPEVAFEPATPGPRKQKAAKRQERRFRQTVVKVDLWSVTKMALCFYVSAMGVVIVSLVALWTVADSAGIIDNVENFIGDLFSSDDFQFVSDEVLRGAALGAVVLVALMVAFTIIAASFYNIFSELFGGVEIVIREEEQPPKR